MKKLAIFDLDNTLVYANSTYGFIHFFLRKKRSPLRFVLYQSIIFLDNLGVLSYLSLDTRKLLFKLLRGFKVRELEVFAKEYVRDVLLKLNNKQLVKILDKQRGQQKLLILATGTLSYIASEYSRLMGFDNYICTKVCEKNGLFTGEITEDTNFNKLYYLKRLIEYRYPDANIKEAYFYTDNKTDLPIINIIRRSFAVVYEKNEVEFWKKNGVRGVIQITERPNLSNKFLVPGSYYFFTRYPLKELFYLHLPLFLLILSLYQRLGIFELIVLTVSWVGYISLYEVGYFQNDCFGGKLEGESFTSRANAVICSRFKFLSLMRLAYFTAVANLLWILLGFSYGLYVYFILNIVVSVIFFLHNKLRKDKRLVTYPFLKLSHLIIPISIFIHYGYHSYSVIVTLLIMYLSFEVIFYVYKNKNFDLVDKKFMVLYFHLPKSLLFVTYSLFIMVIKNNYLFLLIGLIFVVRDLATLVKFSINELKKSVLYVKYFADPESSIRYLVAYKLIIAQHESKKLKILDIGGGSRSIYPELHMAGGDYTVDSLVTSFLDYPNFKNVHKYYPDHHKELKRENYYDFTISLDTLEHIPNTGRVEFLESFFSYKSKFYILAFPAGFLSMSQDKRLYKISKNSKKGLHKYLSEHLEYGLPDVDCIKKHLPLGYSIVREFWHTNLHFRYFFMRLWLTNRVVFLLLSPLIYMLGVYVFKFGQKYRYYVLIKSS